MVLSRIAKHGWTGLALCLVAAPLPAQETRRLSVDSAGLEGNDFSQQPSLDRNGDHVVFCSAADNLVPGDTNFVLDVFEHNVITGVTQRVSVNAGGVQGNGISDSPHLAADGLHIAFRSDADNFLFGDVNARGDIFMYDGVAGSLSIVSRGMGAVPTDGESFDPFASSNGGFVAYTSSATNIVAGDANGLDDVFVFDRVAGTTVCASVDGFGGMNQNGNSGEAALSGSAQFIVFSSDADNLVPGDNNGMTDVFVRDLIAGVTLKISRSPGGGAADGPSSHPWISEDDRYVAFQSDATNLVAGDVNVQTDIFVCDLFNGVTSLVSQKTDGTQGDGPSLAPVISSNGRYVTFTSLAENLAPQDHNGESDIFVHDQNTEVTHRVSLGPDFSPANDGSDSAVISGDGNVVAWISAADDLVTGDANGVNDLFARDIFHATWGNYGAGFPGTLGVPSIGLLSDPVIDLSTMLVIGRSTNAPTIGVVFFGLSEAAIPGSWGGDLLVLPSLVLPIQMNAANYTAVLDIPHVEALEAFAVCLQVLEADPGAANGLSSTEGLKMKLGW